MQLYIHLWMQMKKAMSALHMSRVLPGAVSRL